MTRTMESIDGRLERNFDSDEDFHSASDSLSHGELGRSAALLTIPLAVACVRLQQRAQLQEKISGLSLYPLGLPRLKARRRHTEAFIDGNLQHRSDGLQRPKLPSPRASQEGGYQQPWSDSCNSFAADASSVVQPWSMEGFSSLRETPSVTSGMEIFSSGESCVPTSLNDARSPIFNDAVQHLDGCMMHKGDEDYGYSPRQMRLKKNFQRTSSQEHQLVRSPGKQELEAAQDVEVLTCSSNLCHDREGSSCFSKQRTMDDDDDDDDDNHDDDDVNHDDDDDNHDDDDDSYDDDGDDTIGKKYKGIVDMNKLTIGKLPADSQLNSISSSDFLKARSCGSIFTKQDKGGPWAYGIELNNSEDSFFNIHKNNLCEGSQATIVSKNGAAMPNSRVLQSNDNEEVPTNGGPEQGQLDSLLLWPVGLVVEAIAFQVRLIAQAFSLVAIIYGWCNSFASNRVRETWQAKERATEALSQKVTMISNVPPKVTESGSMVLKRAGWGCFAALYVCILLSMLLLPTLFLDYVFVSKIVEDPVSIKEPLHFDYTLPHPTAVVFLNSSRGKLGSHSELARPIPVSHKVHITVFLTLPESDYNRELGMFQLSAELLSETSETIKISSRPCILRFHSLPIRMLKTFLFGLPSLMGMFTESQTLEVHLMEFEEQLVATHVVRILVQPKAGMPLGQGIPEIYSAVVHIESHLPWLKNMMRNWKWTVYIWTGLTLYVAEIVMILCCCRQALVPKTWVGQNDEIKDDQIGSVDPVEGDESGPSGNQLRKQQGSKRRQDISTAKAVAYRREGKVSPSRQSSI